MDNKSTGFPEQNDPAIPRVTANRTSIVAFIAAVTAAVLLMVWGRSFYGSFSTYRKGEESLREHRTIQAMAYFDRAIHWYTPFNPYVERSAKRLWELSLESEKKGDYSLALAALTSLKSGYVAAAGLFSPGGDWIRRSEERMAMLSGSRARDNPSSAVRPGGDNEGLQRIPPPPRVSWTIALEIGMLGWIGSILGMIACFRRKRPLNSLLRWGVPLVVFYVMWIIGMMRA